MFKQLLILLKVLRDGKKSQKEIESIQHERLRSVLVSAYENVDYYRKIMQEANYNPLTDYLGPEDLKKLPILTKEKLKSLPITAFIHKDYHSSYKNEFSKSSSGSTGMPLTIYRSKSERLLEIAKWLRVLFYNGYTPFDKVLSISDPARLKEGKSFIQKFGLFRRKAIDYNLSTKEIISKIISYKPNILYGNKISFDMLCNAVESGSTTINLNFKFIVIGGEMIPKNAIKRYKKVFNARVVEFYGSIEMGVMAYQVNDEQYLTLNEDLTLFEFLDEKGKPAKPGERSRIIVTDLSEKLMPFIRYDQGDFVYFDEVKKNGETIKIITKIEGRQEDVAKLPNNETITFLKFYSIMNTYKSIKQFRIIQKKIDTFEVLIASESDYFEQISSQLADDLNTISKQKLLFDIKNVSAIPPDPNGKMKILVSEVL